MLILAQTRTRRSKGFRSVGSNRLLGSLFGRNYVDKADAFFRKGQYGKAAELYVKAKRWKQASDAYVHLEEIDTAVEMLAKSGDLVAAGELLQSRQRTKEAISYFEKAKAFRQAAEASVEVRQFPRAGRLFEQAAMYQRAAECFNKAGDIEGALGAWTLEATQLKRQGDSEAVEQRIRQLDLHRAETLEKLSRHAEAGQLFADHGRHTRAAKLFEKADQIDEAARQHLASDRPDLALELLDRSESNDTGLRAKILKSSHRYSEAADLFAELGDFEKAAETAEEGGDKERAANFWSEAERFERAADIFLDLGDFEEAAMAYASAERHEEAAKAFRRAGEFQKAGDAYQAANQLLLAGQHYLKSGDNNAAVFAFKDVPSSHPDYLTASKNLLPLLCETERFDEAAERLAYLQDRAERDEAAWPAAEDLYWQARLAEHRGEATQAQQWYERALAQQPSIEDASERLAELKSQIQPPSTKAAAQTDPPSDRSKTTDTQPIVLNQPKAPTEIIASAEEVSTDEIRAVMAGSAAEELDPSSVEPEPSATGLPFQLDKPLEGWWPGMALFQATDLRRNREALLVSFPLAEIGLDASEFRRVMKRVLPVEHPVILKLDEVILASDKVILLYERFAGHTLSQHLLQGHLSVVTTLFLLSQLCEGLATAHQIGITHQWLSPQTILIDDQGRIKIAGLGMREILAHRDITSRAYLSPELRRGEEVIGPASDVYGLGLLAIELLQAQLPAGWSEAQPLAPDSVLWSPEVEESVPQRVREQFIRCLSLNPLERPSTVELKTALATFGLLPGQILVDRYEILGEVGRGGMSRVYRALDRELDDEVAIKTVLTPTMGPSENAERLLQEVRICRKITHPNVVRVHDFGRFPGGIFIIMEFLEGPGLDQLITEEPKLELPKVRGILRDINAALIEAHELDIVHRDLKPANVIFHRKRLRVMDFGIARMGDRKQDLTQTGQVIGSPRYMAPEQIQGLPLSGTCDLYALGVIAYTLLAGREPFIGENTTSIVLKHLHEPPPDILQFRPDLPDAWSQLLGKLLAKKPSQRPQSAEELAPLLDALPVNNG